MKCRNPECGELIPDHVRSCVVCGADAGFPNVRAAEKNSELGALDKREKEALAQCRKNACEDTLIEFGRAVSQSEAVLCRPISKVLELVSGDNTLYATFYQLTEAESRLPENNRYDAMRQAIDSTLFPRYFAQIRVAALSLDERGVKGYGDSCLVIKDAAISNRASVFEENPFLFCTKHGIKLGDPIPPGYRATWANRGRLAIAKLGKKIDSKTELSDFPSILLETKSAKDVDFIEVHIYGPIHRRAIKRLVAKKPTKKADKVLLKSVRRKLREIGVNVEIKL